MSLKNRIDDATVNRANDGCHTCRWLSSLDDTDRKAFNDWLDNPDNSRRQLYELCFTDPDNPLLVSETGFRAHLRHHRRL